MQATSLEVAEKEIQNLKAECWKRECMKPAFIEEKKESIIWQGRFLHSYQLLYAQTIWHQSTTANPHYVQVFKCTVQNNARIQFLIVSR